MQSVDGVNYLLSNPCGEMSQDELRGLIKSDVFNIARVGSEYRYDEDSECVLPTTGIHYFMQKSFGLGLSYDQDEWVEIEVKECDSLSELADQVMYEEITPLKFESLDNLITHLIEERPDYVIVQSPPFVNVPLIESNKVVVN
jgi:hypothetical protein